MSETTYNLIKPEKGAPVKAWTKGVPLEQEARQQLLNAAQLPFIFNFFWSIWKGEKVTENPWQATTIEWSAPSPPPHGNFVGAPAAYRGPYEYSVPGAPKDFWPQYEA